MNNYLKQWDASRIIRLVAGIGFAVYAFTEHEYLFLIIAGMFLLQAIFNISCCGAGCSTTEKQKTKRVYEGEIKAYKPNK